MKGIRYALGEDDMLTEVSRRLFTTAEYHQMAKAGILREGEPVELIDGEIVKMSPKGHRHWVCVNRATALFSESFGRKAMVAIQGPIQLDDWNEPEPDVVVFKSRSDFYQEKRASPEDVLFIVEVADSSLAYDRKVKLTRYAKAGIQEYWIEDLNNDVLLVFRDPSGEAYHTFFEFRAGDSVSPLAFPHATFKIDDLLGQRPSIT